MTLQPLPSKFPIYEENFILFFISVAQCGKWDPHHETSDTYAQPIVEGRLSTLTKRILALINVF